MVIWKNYLSVLCLALLGPVQTAYAQNVMQEDHTQLEQELAVDSIPLNVEIKKSRNIFQKIGDYFKQSNQEVKPGKFDITFIGGPHYSAEKRFGIGLLAAGVYRPDYSTPPSNLSLFGDISTVGYYQIGIMGNHIKKGDVSRINYEFYFSSFPCYFWGIGFEEGFIDSNKTKYSKLQTQLKAEWLWRVADDMFLGPAIDFSYISAKKRERPEPWLGYAPTTYSYGIGGKYEYDTRDNLTAPNKGMVGTVLLKAYPSFLFNKYPFGNIELTYSYYHQIWKGGVMAVRAHTLFSVGRHVPWGMLPSMGGSYNMRGYYAGRYCDRNEADVTVELRQHVWRRNGIAVWLGAGEVFPDFKGLRMKNILPSWGLGYRWEFKKNINIRMDIGFGRRSSNFIFAINEAF